MNPEKLKKLQAEVRIGGKGTQRRKKKIVHSTQAFDDKKLQQTLKKLSLNMIPGIEEVNIIKTDGTVLNFKNPKTQASMAINTFAITGNPVTKTITEMLPYILPQLGPKELQDLQKTTADYKKKAGTDHCSVRCGGSTSRKCSESRTEVDADSDDGDEIPQLVDNFEAVALNDADETKTSDNVAEEKEESQ